MKASLVVAVGLLLSAVGYSLLLPKPATGGSRLSIVGTSYPLRVLILYASMLLGIFARSAQEYLGDSEIVSLGHLLSFTYTSPSFVKGVLVSPIVFFAVYKLSASQPDNIVATLFAFQNGFFWQTVLGRAKP